ncbi:hypothetical protein ACWJJH_07835 [Endozoicomonadaceae bacterium StTr2]
MNINKLKYGFLAALILLLSGCASWSVVKKSELVSKDGSFKVQAPIGWVMGPVDNKGILLTEEGPGLHRIIMNRVDHKNAFKSIEKSSSPDLLPTELADYYLAEFKKTHEGVEVKKLELQPAMLAGEAGFRMKLQVVTPKGLKLNTLAYGLSRENGFYELSYSAPELHYYDRDLEIFEKIVGSFETL